MNETAHTRRQRGVWRYRLDWTAEPQDIEMPPGATVIHVGLKPGRLGGELNLWAEIDLSRTGHLLERRTFQVFGTGDGRIPHQAVHVGTAIAVDSSIVTVWHVYELLPAQAPS